MEEERQLPASSLPALTGRCLCVCVVGGGGEGGRGEGRGEEEKAGEGEERGGGRICEIDCTQM